MANGGEGSKQSTKTPPVGIAGIPSNDAQSVPAIFGVLGDFFGKFLSFLGNF